LFESKVPGVQMKLKPVEMDFTYKESHAEATPEAYEALLLDVIEGDATLFMRSDLVETGMESCNANPGCMEKGSEKIIA
jgi:glucose-6-phosphate 1-dehydrogenase